MFPWCMRKRSQKMLDKEYARIRSALEDPFNCMLKLVCRKGHVFVFQEYHLAEVIFIIRIPVRFEMFLDLNHCYFRNTIPMKYHCIRLKSTGYLRGILWTSILKRIGHSHVWFFVAFSKFVWLENEKFPRQLWLWNPDLSNIYAGWNKRYKRRA